MLFLSKYANILSITISDLHMINKIISSISKNHPFSIEELNSYRELVDWDSISCNTAIPWCDMYIDEFKDKLNFSWNGLAMNPSLPITRDFLIKFHDLFEWTYLTDNPAIPWSIELLEEFKEDWAWECIEFCGNTGLSLNRDLPWSEELIEKFEDKWFWGELSSNPSLPWSKDFLLKYKDRWTWDGHHGNWGLSINPSHVVRDLLTQYFPDRIDYKYFDKPMCFHNENINKEPLDDILKEYINQYGLKKMMCCINITTL